MIHDSKEVGFEGQNLQTQEGINLGKFHCYLPYYIASLFILLIGIIEFVILLYPILTKLGLHKQMADKHGAVVVSPLQDVQLNKVS